jgi:glycosyltransferase involved in cell wall biosynthesis
VEIIVVDDASTDDSPSVAARMGVRVLWLAKNSGPGAARNCGARSAQGDILFFIDSDVVVAPDAVSRVTEIFKLRPYVAAVFGSYDARPRARGVVSQYRNLLRHFAHQRGNPEASTFWTGCGAVRRSVFEAVGSFDEQFTPRARWRISSSDTVSAKLVIESSSTKCSREPISSGGPFILLF